MHVNAADECTRTLWAKSDPYHPLWCHLLDTGAVCNLLIESLGIVMELPQKWAVFLAAAHDIGKADPEFQIHHSQSKETLASRGLPFFANMSSGFRHEARSGEWIYEYLTSIGWGKYAASVAEASACGHHGNFHPKSCGKDSTGYLLWKSQRDKLGGMIAAVIGINDEPFCCSEFLDASITGVYLVGLTVLSDWIASNAELFRFTLLDTNTNPSQYWLQAQNEAVRAINALKLNPNTNSSDYMKTPLFCDMWPDICELKPSQRAVESACLSGIAPGLAIIEAPMGEGKTESAIYLAEYWKAQCGLRGTYIALPTMATSNQMFGRYEKFQKKLLSSESSPRLVHGMAWLMDDDAPEYDSEVHGEDAKEERLLARDWFRPSKRALIAPAGVGTIDQALMAALNVKHGFLRLLGLSAKALIIDEVHAYDEYMTTILECLLKWLRKLRVPVIMLSATLSYRQKKKLIEAYGGNLPECDASAEPYPLITFLTLDGEMQCVKVEKQPARSIRVDKRESLMDDANKTAALAVQLVKNGGCACVLVNTVKQAQNVFNELEKFDGQRYLFHARFPAWRRNEIEKQVVDMFGKDGFEGGRRPKKAILVATQVVEQSLDLDFDVMVSQLAPIDLLLQRAGRLWRHKNIGISRYGLDEAMYVLLPDGGSDSFGGSECIYSRSALLRTVATLKKRDMFSLPEDFRPFIEDCYGDGSVMNDMHAEREADIERDLKRDLDASKASVCLISEPNHQDFALANMTGKLYNETDDATRSYMDARTRLDRKTCSVIILEDPALIEVTHKSKPPQKKVMKDLFLCKADIPAYWIKDAVNIDGTVAFPAGPKWLRNAIPIPMKSGEWQGLKNGKVYRITFNKLLGLEENVTRRARLYQ